MVLLDAFTNAVNTFVTAFITSLPLAIIAAVFHLKKSLAKRSLIGDFDKIAEFDLEDINNPSWTIDDMQSLEQILYDDLEGNNETRKGYAIRKAGMIYFNVKKDVYLSQPEKFQLLLEHPLVDREIYAGDDERNQRRQCLLLIRKYNAEHFQVHPK
jgi:hypothetical protein